MERVGRVPSSHEHDLTDLRVIRHVGVVATVWVAFRLVLHPIGAIPCVDHLADAAEEDKFFVGCVVGHLSIVVARVGGVGVLPIGAIPGPGIALGVVIGKPAVEH